MTFHPEGHAITQDAAGPAMAKLDGGAIPETDASSPGCSVLPSEPTSASCSESASGPLPDQPPLSPEQRAAMARAVLEGVVEALENTILPAMANMIARTDAVVAALDAMRETLAARRRLHEAMRKVLCPPITAPDTPVPSSGEKGT